MQGVHLHQGAIPAAALPAGPGGGRIWLVSGTGDGPPLALALLARGWRVRVSVVGAAAARAYRPDPDLEVQIGALHDPQALADALQRDRFRWVVDASHPFAQRISQLLTLVCGQLQQPLLCLRRGLPETPGPAAPGESITWLEDLEHLGQLNLATERLLLAIGSRHLGQALACSNASFHGARILANPLALQLALAAGLADHQLAPITADRLGRHPIAGLHLDRALCRHWGITAVLCRQSGGPTEQRWRQLAREEQLHLLLLRQPQQAGGGLAVGELLARIGHPGTSDGPGHGP